MSGTATRGSDYVLQTNSVTFTTSTVIIPAGQRSINVSLVVSNDTVAELTETAILSVGGSPFYSVGVPASVSVDISDNEPVAADVTVVPAHNV